MQNRSAIDKRIRNATTAGAWLQVLMRTLAARGHDGARLAHEAGVPARNLRRPSERVPQIAMTRLWKLAVKATNDPCLGLDVARYVTGSTFGALTHVAFVSPTLEDAFRRIVRFQRLMTDALALDLIQVGERYRLTIQPIAPGHPPAEEIDAFLATWVRVTRGLAPTQPYVEPLRVHRRRVRPACAVQFEKVFRAPIQFRATEDFIEYDRSDCKRTLPDSNLQLAQQYDQILARQAAELAGASVSDKVRALLFEVMADGPTESAIARRMCMSKSLLKASLAGESTTYRAILEEVRATLARRYLQEQTYPIKEIAFLLGYAGTSTFNRAFKRWTGATPRCYGADDV